MKLIHLIIKDLRIQFKSIFELLIFYGLPIVIALLMSFMFKGIGKNLIIYVEEKLANDFNNKEEITVEYIEKDYTIAIEYLSKDIIIENIAKDRYPIAYYEENGKKILYINRSNRKSDVLYDLIYNYFYPITEKKFEIHSVQNISYNILSIGINMFIIMASLSLAIYSLREEIVDKNILILKKAGITNFEILISKLLYILIIEMPFFTIYYFLLLKLNIIEYNLALLYLLPIIIILSAQIGLFISSITINRHHQTILMYFLWMPSLLYFIIEKSLSNISKILLRINPLINNSILIDQILRKDVSFYTIIYCVITFIIFFVLSLIFMKRTILKNM